MILDAYHTVEPDVYNRRTDREKRVKRLRQIISVSAKRESQTLDLVVANMELQFFKQFVAIVDKVPNLYVFQSVDDVFVSEFLDVSPLPIQHLLTPIVFSHHCPKILPDNQRVGDSVWSVSPSPFTGPRCLSTSMSLACMKRKWNTVEIVAPCFRECSVTLPIQN